MKGKIAILLLAAMTSQAGAGTIEEQFAQATELFLPAHLYACKLHYSDMQPYADEILNFIGYEKRTEPGFITKRETIKECLRSQPVLEYDDCVTLFKSIYTAANKEPGSRAGNEAAQRYLELTERTQSRFDAVMMSCPEAKARALTD